MYQHTSPATTNPNNAPAPFARLVKIPSANVPAKGTPRSPIYLRNKSQVSFWLEFTKYNAAIVPNTPAMMMIIRANRTSCLASLLNPKKRCLISTVIQAEIEFKLDAIVD